MDLISVISLRMLKRNAITQSKSLGTMQMVFAGTAKQVIVDLELTVDQDHLLDGLEEKKVVATQGRGEE